MHKDRLLAFSDGVFAIIITIALLEFKTPQGHDASSLTEVGSTFFSYLMSFVYLATYHNNHSFLFMAVEQIDGVVMWTNMMLLFFLSLVTFTSGWMGESHFATFPVVLYGVILLLAGFSYYLMVLALLRIHGNESALAQAVQAQFKERVSVASYSAAIGLAFVNAWVSVAIYAAVALMWIVPDSRISRVLHHRHGHAAVSSSQSSTSATPTTDVTLTV